MLKILKKFIIFSPEKKTLLGRWNRNNNVTVTSSLSNYDHCGDTICKDPKEVQKLIKLELDKSKSK